ncbi:EAL domain-containing protein [Methylopila sp. M107]|uniref:bifunctional diguanylate cyclase/phosphodiesterase n=1 Tax=Methylopila sp. M107 TaxID=1101190 RepID=UPI00036F6B7B|nr:EAL domain-containing protein [Methylopila sp. M107]
MPTTHTNPGAFIWRILVPLVGALVVTLAFSVWTLVEIAARQDAETERRSTTLLDFSFSHRSDDLVKIIRDYSYWGQAYKNTHIKFDRAWAYDGDNLGRSLFNNFSIDYLALVDPQDETIYIVQDGQLVANQEFKGVLEQLGDLVQEARGLSEDSPAVRKVIAIAGAPTVFAAAPMTTGGDPSVQAVPGPPTILLFGDQLSLEDLSDMSAKSLLSKLRVARDAADAAAKPHLTLAPGDAPQLTLRWDPRKPGSDLLRDFGPWLGLAALVLLALVGLIVGFARDATKTIESGARKLELAFRDAEHRSLHDPATGLPNRARLMAHLATALEKPSPCVAVVYCDLDSFKLINDTLGHPVGDFVLEVTAARLRAAAREDDLVSRVGGDEFVIVARRNTVEEVETLCRALLAAAPQPIEHLQHKLRVGLSIGVALAPRDATEAAELVRLADIALYQVKARGRRSFRFYQPEMSDGMFARAGMEHELARAIGSGELLLTFDPILDANTMNLVQVEARPMWRHPARGLIAADDFLPMAEETEMIGPLVAWLLRASCMAAAKWNGVDLAVTIPIRRLQPEQFGGHVEEALKSSGLEGKRLELCVTDASMLARAKESIAALERARTAGVLLSVAAENGGCPSMDALAALRFDVVRVGPRFLRSLRATGFERGILRSMIELAHSFGAIVTATGVETPDQLLLVQYDQCARVQGPLVAKPKKSGELGALLARDSAFHDRMTIGRKA